MGYLGLEFSAAVATAVPLPGGATPFVPAQVLLDGQAAKRLVRTSDGQLWIALPTGSHQVTLEGPLPARETVQLPLPLKAFAGLTMRQLMVAIIGLALAYSAMSEAPVPLAIRLTAGATVLLMTAAISFWQPAGRSLEEWAFVLLRYVSIPRVVVWRVRTSREAATAEEPRFLPLEPPLASAGERSGADAR